MGVKEVEIDAIGQAIAGTEKEIFEEAHVPAESDAEDVAGDRSPEEMGEGLEGQHETDEGEAEIEAADEGADDESDADDGEADTDRDPKTGKFVAKDKDAEAEPDGGKTPAERRGQVPSGRLREERTKREAAEAALKETSEASRREIAELKSNFERFAQQVAARLEGNGQQPRPGQQQPQRAEEEIDIFTNPDAFIQRRIEQATKPVVEQLTAVQAGREADRVEFSMQLAHRTHGETFDKAYSALTQMDRNDPNARAIVQRIWSQPNPGEAMVQWHLNRETLREVGPDPKAYRQKVRDELLKDPDVRKELIAALRDDAAAPSTPNGKPRSAVRLPPSLNGARGSNTRADHRVLDGSDKSAFEDAFTDN